MKTWFITGSASGLGRTLTTQLLERGERVFATARKTALLNDLKEKYSTQLYVAQLDVTNTAQVHQVMQEAFNTCKQIDVIINNAAYGLFGSVEEVSDEQLYRQVHTNLTGSIQVIRAALPYLRAQKSGHILQLSSAGGQASYPNYSYYHATKWGIEGFCETVAQEIAPFNIGLTIIEPGALRNTFVNNMDKAAHMPEYDNTPARDVYNLVMNNAFPIPGDPEKTARAIIDAVNISPVPLRLALGSDSYHAIHKALTDRLAALEAHKALTLSTDITV
jgi:NADP-dependent 3-hydroxy acid dehydrogenase YdfG